MGVFSIFKKLPDSIKITARAIVTLTLIACFVGFIALNYNKIIFKHKIQRINASMPASFGYLLNPVESSGQGENEKILSFIRFYKQITEFFPDQADAYNMLGFCYFYIGETEKSIEAYQQSLALKPDFFWSNYNLGSIYYNMGEYVMAKESFVRARSNDPNLAYQMVLNSNVIYKSILLDTKTDGVALKKRLNQGYKNCDILIQMIDQKKTLTNNKLKIFLF